MHIIPENFQEKRSRFYSVLNPDYIEDSNFQLLNLPFATYSRLERFQGQSEYAYLKIKNKLDRRYQKFEADHPVWNQEKQRQADLLIEKDREILDDCAAELNHLDWNLHQDIETLVGDLYNYDLTQESCVLKFLAAKEQFEVFIRRSEKIRAATLLPFFEELEITPTNLDIGLGIVQFN